MSAHVAGWMRRCAALAAILLASGCSAAGARDQQAGQGGDSGRELVVFAAASLTESFTEVEKAFEATHPDIDVRMSFEGSSALAQKIVRGAPADVFASANPRQMRLASEAGRIAGEPTTFVRNHLRIAVPAGNPAGVTGLAAFGDPARTIALCAEQVPCGAAARDALRAAGVTPRPDTLERNVKAVLTKVRLGEVDAGLVYRTDIATAGDAVTGVGFPAASEAVNDYRIATLDAGAHAAAARTFVRFVLGSRARTVLAEHGFDTDT